MEIAWLHEHGLAANYRDYLDLPLGVLQDARLLARAEDIYRRRQERKRG